MKKFIFILLTGLFAASPFMALADIAPGTLPTAGQLGIQESPIQTSQGVLNIVASVVRWVYTIFFVIAILFIIFAAFNYLTGASAPEKISSAHKQLIYAAIAIAVALLAVSAQVIVGNFLRGNDAGGAGGPSGGSPQYWVPSPDYPGGPVSA